MKHPLCEMALALAACCASLVCGAIYATMLGLVWLTANLVPTSAWGVEAQRIVAHELEQWERWRRRGL